MKTLTKLSLSLATLLTLSSSTLLAEDNLIKNGNFERIFDKIDGIVDGNNYILKDWNSKTKIWTTVDGTDAIRGTYMIELDKNTTTTDEISQPITTTKGKKYELKLQAFSRDLNSSSFRVSLGAKDNTLLTVYPDKNVTTYSTIFDGTGDVNATLAIREFSRQNEGKGAVIDDISIVELNYVPEVDAGEDKVVEIDTDVILKGVAHDADGEIVSYVWKKGEEVLANTAKLTYSSNTVGGETLTLTATDNENNSVSDTIFLDVRRTNRNDCLSKTYIDNRKTAIKKDVYGLTFSSFLMEDSSFSYCKDEVDTLGAAFKISYSNPDGTNSRGSSMDGYPNGSIGGTKISNKWLIGDKNQTGMPIQLSKLGKENKIIVEWKVSQEDAYDSDDKWQATINCIFGKTENNATEKGERDYDLVIESDKHRFGKGLDDDNSTEEEGEFAYYFARIKGEILPFTISIDNKEYSYAVRYRIHYLGDKYNKIHVKYIPLDKANVPREFKYDIQEFIKNSKDYLRYSALKKNVTEAEYLNYKDSLANKSLYLKAINAGYEVYEGVSVLKNDYFRVKLVPVAVE